MKSEFETMPLRQLKHYVLEHRHDRVAFRVLMERIDAQPQHQVYSEVEIEQFANLLKQHQDAQQN